MLFLPLLSFLLWFYLFVASGALTFLSARAWFSPAHAGPGGGVWPQKAELRAIRTIGFLLITIAALTGAVSQTGEGARTFDAVSLARVIGYVLLWISLPRRLRQRRVVMLAFALQVVGEALLLLNARAALPPPFSAGGYLTLAATLVMDVDIALLWRCLTRTVMRVRLTDTYTLAFAAFSLLLMIVLTVSVVAVIRATLQQITGSTDVDMAFRNVGQPLMLLLVVVVVASALIAFFLARTLTAPVGRMAAAVQAIGHGDLDVRLRGFGGRDEMQGLAREINQMARRLQESDQQRAEFISFASHELRSPLTAIQGFVEILQSADSSQRMTLGERAEIYEIVRGECARLLRLTNELLDTSRVEAGRPVSLNLQRFDMGTSVAKVAGIMQAHAREREIVTLIPPSVVWIEADQDKFEQVLFNILSNAIKYSPDDSCVRIGIQEGESVVEVAVYNQGQGMTKEQAERVFDKFYRITDERGHTKAQGTGLGLYLTRALVMAHGGSIRVASAPGAGATFTVTLPKTQSTPAG